MHYGTNQKFGGGPGQDLGGLCPPGPSLKPPLLRTSNFYEHSQYRSEQKPVTNFGKSSRGRRQTLDTHRIARSSLRQLSFLVYIYSFNLACT